MRTVDAEALLNEIQARYAEASQEARALEQDEDDVEIVARAQGEAHAWAKAGELVQAHLKAAPEVPQDVADQLVAAGLIIARLVALSDRPVRPYLPNEIPATLQVPAMHLLQAAGLDMHGRRVEG